MKKLAIASMALFLFACGDESTSPTEIAQSCELKGEGPIEITSPKAGDTFNVGDTVVVSWVMDPTELTGVMPNVSKNDGKTWSQPLTESSLFTNETKLGCYEWTWVIAEEDVLDNGEANSTVRVRIRDYSDVVKNGASEAFTVNP